MKKNKIELEAMNLPLEQRAELAQKLLLSLEEESEADIEKEWAVEATKRAKELDEGLVEAIPADVVLKKAKELLR